MEKHPVALIPIATYDQAAVDTAVLQGVDLLEVKRLCRVSVGEGNDTSGEEIGRHRRDGRRAD